MKRMAVVLAAGQGKRMKSKLYKVLHPVCGKPMVGHVMDTVEKAACEEIVVVTGHGAAQVQSFLEGRAKFVLQEQQLGTGHAVQQAEALLSGKEGTTIVICGDTPLVTAETIESMLELHESSGAAATVLTAEFTDPTGYGRVVRGAEGAVERIVEQKDCSPAEAAVQEINTGTYCFDNRKLFEALARVTNDNAQGEYYLTDVIGIFVSAGESVQAYCTSDLAEAIGVNDRIALGEAERLMRERIVRRHQINGVTFIDTTAAYIEAEVEIGADTVIYPGTVLRGATVIGEDCVIGPQADIKDSVIGNGVAVRYSTIDKSEAGEGTSIGPYANLRPGSKLGKDCKIGDFVELKNAVIGDESKVSHLSYVGDAEVGSGVNIGCGAITVNYDGFNKAKTVIGNDAFIGSNVNLIAPVNIGDGAYVVAGSTVTHDVPGGDLAIARERQVNKPGYADKIRARAKAKKERGQG
ncbi:bifunctional UDP-N-acetylglucosamine diphosphorylase/glucosamine-1-phosphate N-acetyltransferase GlmU [Paenibacillus pasadenensis]|uniref:bifunctional UDP-N-acetylglucosamine diphosphorylase/glucosamine-1-phosphate N-acetyltransferase GlmU n=1 Tax=Paenibacillus pasadenensis TaxID=217090 RepID=UPI00255951FE|nr:bifunctional UDP-N-acetylglucosamine diphosphorylase/glucosamine-1-phosphate N-acetyltransferase GlmU [Paenibacillus pasadenensis]